MKIKVFNYPFFTDYHCFREENDSHYHNYAKIIKNNNIYNLIDVGGFNIINIWDFYKKDLIKSISSNSNSILGGFFVINNKYLIIGSADQEIKEFDITNGILIKKINKHQSTVLGIKSIINNKNQHFFMSYGDDKNIYLWNLK